MKPIYKKLIMLISVTCLWISVAKGAVDGSFTYFGYEIEFLNGTLESYGETKSVLSESIDITVTSSNTFTADFDDYRLSRSITNQPVNTGDLRLYNAYAVEITNEPGSVGGDIAISPELRVDLLMEGEAPLPFYFNTSTQVALSLVDADTNLGIGVLIRKSSGMNVTDINGTFVRYTLGNVFEDLEAYGWGSTENLYFEQSTMTFNGSGNYVQTGTGWTTSRETNEREVNFEGHPVVDTYFTLPPTTQEPLSFSSTYAVDSAGTLTLATEIGNVINQISPDGNLAASSMCVEQGTNSAGAYFTVAVKQPENMPTNAIDAVYFTIEFNDGFDGDSQELSNNNWLETSRSYIFLRSDSTFSIRSDFWDIYNNMNNAHGYINGDAVSANYFSSGSNGRSIELDRGSYSITSNGVVTLNFAPGDSAQVQISANGEYLVYGNNEGDSHHIGIGIHRDAPPPPSSAIGFGKITSTTNGINMTLSIPTNCPTEIIHTDNLNEGDWRSSGVYSNATGILQFFDPEAINANRRFYCTTFAPW